MKDEIVIEHVDKFYGKKKALSDVTMTIGTGMFGLLGRNGAGKPIEMMISFVGIVMMIAVFIPEQDKALKESVACRKIGLEAIRFIRMIISVFFIVFFVATYCVYLKANECQISLYMIWGGISSAFFLGSISFCVAGISGNSINGILAGMVYYLCNYGLKKQLV